MLKKICKCGKLVSLADGMCNDCKDKLEQSNKERHNKYKAERTDVWEQRFYMSKPWKQTSKAISVRDKGLCIVCLANNRIVSKDVTHHIIELKEDRNKALVHSNLISLCDKCHKKVHDAYRTNKLNMQEILRQLVQGRG